MIVLKQQPSSSTTSLRNRVQRLDIKSWAANRRLGQVLQAIVDARVVDVKEVLEAAEFVERVRRRVRRRVCLDLAAGHGLVGALLALDPAVENVIAVDTRQPASHALLLNALATVAPEAAHKVRSLQSLLLTSPYRRQVCMGHSSQHSGRAASRGRCLALIKYMLLCA
jgi:flagellar biosynthesis component FlhA